MQAKDSAEFTELVQRHAALWYRVALRVVLDHAAAQDVVQDACVKIWGAWDSFRGTSARSTWAYRVVLNEALTAKRRARPTETLDASQHAGIPDSPYFEADAALTALYQAVASLPERQRLVFQLGTSEGGLKANYHHAVAKIKKTMVGLNLDLHSES
jgi:RNA polymerase sigma-70 factor (ECF subfamily)